MTILNNNRKGAYMRTKAVIITIVLIFSMFLFSGGISAATTDPPDDTTGDSQTDVDQTDPGETDAADVDADDDEVPRPPGWTTETHGKKGDPNYEVVFPDDKVNRLDITITAADWQAMMDDLAELLGPRREPGSSSSSSSSGAGGCDSSDLQAGEEDEGEAPGGCESGPGGGGLEPQFMEENPVYKPCTMVFEGKTWYHVGIRFKGNSTLMASWQFGSYKLPLRFTFDQFEDDFPEIDNQRFYGFQKVGMSSNFADSSFLREKVAADIFRDAGVPAPHTAFYRVFIDYGEGSKYFGLYTMVEIPDDPMLKTQFSDDDGNLYKPSGLGATFAEYVEEDFDKENNKGEADYSDVRALYDALNADRTDAAVWRADLEKTLDVDGFLRWLAVNTTIQNWDTYGQMAQNYYLYNDPGDTQLHWIPWDNNMALLGGRALALELTPEQVDDQWPLIRYLIDDPVYHAIYVKYVDETIRKTFYPFRMRPIYKAAHDMIRPYVVGDEGEVEGYTVLSNPDAFDRGLTNLNRHVQRRVRAARTFISENQP